MRADNDRTERQQYRRAAGRASISRRWLSVGRGVCDSPCEFHERHARRMRRVGNRYRHAVVACLSHPWIDRNPREQLRPLLRGHPLAAAVTKQFVALAAIGTDKIAHVLD